jgi:hypothetical protein
MLSEILSIVIGVFFVYLLLSLICSTLVEWLSKIFSLKGEVLRNWIQRLLRQDKLADGIYGHPLIDVLTPEGLFSRPSEIPPSLFAVALTETLVGKDRASEITTTAELREAIGASDCVKETKQALDAVLRGAGDKVESAYEAIGQWFEGPMGLVAAAYKNMTVRLVFFIALAATLLLNLDTLLISRTLWQHADLRAAVEVEAAAFTEHREAVEERRETDPARAFFLTVDELSTLGIPLGWSRDPEDPRALPQGRQAWLLKGLGLFATVVAASLGAHFWFDMLQRLIGLRHK